MKYFKGFLSIAGALVFLISGAAMAGVVTISAAGISFLLALAGAATTFGAQLGVTFFQLTPALARALGAVSLLIAAGLGAHGQWLVAFAAAHLWVNPLLHWIGLAGVLMGFAATHPAAAPTPAPALAKLDAPPSVAK
ncbi:MAG TPA: hypothetical protein VGR66_01750 [Candidatus Eisenbacteria bacterium]|jgi:hypothetical protein|nr:hypothetical protein [Candidatus Eisenbacteria bacterium]